VRPSNTVKTAIRTAETLTDVTGDRAETCNACGAALESSVLRATEGVFETQLKNCPTTAVTEYVLAAQFS